MTNLPEKLPIVKTLFSSPHLVLQVQRDADQILYTAALGANRALVERFNKMQESKNNQLDELSTEIAALKEQVEKWTEEYFNVVGELKDSQYDIEKLKAGQDELKSLIELASEDAKKSFGLITDLKLRAEKAEAQRDELKRQLGEARERLELFEKPLNEPVNPSDVIEDGFGGMWGAYCPECGKKSMHVVRPGKVQCGECG